MQIDLYHANQEGDTCFLVDEGEYFEIQQHLNAKGIPSSRRRELLGGSAELAVPVSIRRLNKALSDYERRWNRSAR